MKAMSYRRVRAALLAQGCTMRQGKGDHEIWTSPAGAKAVLPHRTEISPGVLRDLVKKLTDLPKGWLQ